MRLPLWVYDYKQKKYVVFPLHLLETFPDGKQGFYQRTLFDKPAAMDVFVKFQHLLRRERYPDNIGGLQGLHYDCGTRYVLKERRYNPQDKPQAKGPRWYSQDEAQIKKFKRTRPHK